MLVDDTIVLNVLPMLDGGFGVYADNGAYLIAGPFDTERAATDVMRSMAVTDGDKVSDEPRRRLTKNAARCLRCGDVIESKHRHDLRWCSCRSLFVDGGLAYARFGWNTFGYPSASPATGVGGGWEDLCEYADES